MIHSLDPDDTALVSAIRAAASSTRGTQRGIEARAPFDALMESVLPRNDVTFETDAIGGVPGVWVRPIESPSDAAILHLHGGWFNFGTAQAYRHLVGHIAARAGVKAFVPDYRLAPEHPFPAALEDVVACYRGLEGSGIRRIALTGDSAGGNLALVLATRTSAVAVAVLSPVTDLTLSAETYETRADADPFFTRPQIAELVNSYLSGADPRDSRASPLYSQFAGLPAVSVHVGDDEVLLDDSRRYVERALTGGVDASLDIWMGMPHGFVASVGKLKAADRALDATGVFLTRAFSSTSRGTRE